MASVTARWREWRDFIGRSRQTFFSIMDPRIFRKNLKFKVFEGRVTSNRVYCSMCSTKCCCKFVQLLTLTNKLAANVEGFTKMGKVAHIIC